MLQLYHNDMSTCAQKLGLAEKAVSWQSRHLDLRARDHQTPEYLRLNPIVVVPTIVYDGISSAERDTRTIPSISLSRPPSAPVLCCGVALPKL
jgi:hypothetical protein